MSDNQDEIVNGAEVCARILNSMPESRRRFLISQMTAKDPSVLKRIADKLVSFSDIAYLNARGVQLLIKESDHNTLVQALKLADDAAYQTILTNMTDRKRQITVEDIKSLPKIPRAQAEEAQKIIVQKLDELRTKGMVQLRKSEDLWV